MRCIDERILVQQASRPPASGRRVMIYAKDLNLRYYPIGKVACSSINFALLSACGVSCEPGHALHVQVATDLHYVITDGEVQQTPEPLEDAGFGFALVRNPFDRVVSAYVNKVLQRDTNTGL